jgi:glycosidase
VTGGDIAGIRARLPYLQDLGVNALYTTPLFAAPSNHKYDTSDYYRLTRPLAPMTTSQPSVREAHARGLRFVLTACSTIRARTGSRFGT